MILLHIKVMRTEKRIQEKERKRKNRKKTRVGMPLKRGLYQYCIQVTEVRKEKNAELLLAMPDGIDK